MPSGYDKDFRRNPYANEDLVPFNVQQYTNRRAMRIFVITALVLFLFIIGLVLVYLPGTRDRKQAPRIETDSAPYKVELENPGGEIVPNQDKSVYDVMTGSAGEGEAVTPKLTEDPIDLPKAVPVDVQDAAPVNIELKTEPAIAAPATPKPAVPSQTQSVNSDYVVQVASVRSEQAAQDIWDGLQSNSRSILPRGAVPDIKRVNLENKGIFYRLRIAGLNDKASAARLCGQLKAQNQACFVTRK